MVADKEVGKKKDEKSNPIRGRDWERTFTIEERRVNEYVDLYKSIGYEVRVEPATPDEIQECQVCFKAEFDNLRTIFIKRTKNKESELDLEEIM
ncbi:MAG: hypothetical protein ACXAEX_12575 [Promethearchaeota archaeon]|jgi:hypothetical protein